MKKFHFQLKQLLWYHQQRQKQADVQVRHAALQRDAVLAEIQAIQQQIEAACQLGEQVGQAINVSARQSVTAHLQVLGQTLTATREKLQKAEQRVREATEARTRITKDVEGLLHLRARQFAEYQDEIARQQQIVLDEVVMRKWSMRDADTTA
jgi:flagellar export protein FliJ